MSKNRKKTRGKGFTVIGKAITLGALCLSASALPYAQAFALDNNALPGGGVVIGGSAGFDYSSPNELHINQNTDRVIINWDNFNIGADALTQFHQNSSSSIAVNRVTGPGLDPTQILGTLKANGRVIVLDRNGVIFGQNSVVDVGGIIASTGDIDTASFMQGDSKLKITGADQGQIVLNGQLSVADAGLAAFVAPTVINNGVIKARLGKVELAGATQATLDLYGDGLTEIAVLQNDTKTLVANAGMINAAGGKVSMTAAAAKNVVDSIVNMSGIITVASAEQKGGKIILSGPETKVSGKLDVSGKTGGGEILVGGDYQGGGTVAHAKKTTVVSGTVIKANTTGDNGDGGKVILWSDDTTMFAGRIEAKGGNVSGNGGLVETSGKINLGVSGDVNASAPNGLNGEWLLDPSNVIIMGTGGNNIAGGTTNPPSDSYQISASSIQTALNSGNNVTITTTNAGGTQAGDITTSGTVSISKTSGGNATLTLKADHNILLSNTTITSNTGLLNVVLNADRDANQDGAIQLTSASINTNGGYFVAGGGSGTLFGTDGIQGNADDAASTGADNVAAWGNSTYEQGIVLDTSSVNTGAGNIYLKGQGVSASVTNNSATSSQGVVLKTSSVTASGSGSIKIDGVAGGTAAGAGGFNIGAYIRNGSSVTTGAGNITINGVGGAGGAGNDLGVSLSNNGVNSITTTSGAINVTGTKGASGTAISISSVGGGIFSLGSGTIALNSVGAGGVSAQASTTIGSASATGNISIITDSVNFDPNSLIRTTGTLFLLPKTVAANIGLGGGTGGLNLDDGELTALQAGKLVIGDSVNGTGDINVDSWDLSGKTFDVELYGNDINFNDTDATASVDYALKLGTGNFLARAKDGNDIATLRFDARILKAIAGSSKLDLLADRDIVFSSANINTSIGSLNVQLNSDRNADNSGAVSITSSAITTNGGYFIAGGGGGTLFGVDGIYGTTDDTVSTGADNVAAWGSGSTYKQGVYLGNGDISTGAGAIILNGHGWNDGTTNSQFGINVSNGSELVTTSGAIMLKGTGGNGVDTNFGIDVTSSGTKISSQTGAIILRGTGGAGTGQYNQGVVIENNAAVESTGSASINITGQRGGGTTNNDIVTSSTATIGGSSATGDITLNADIIQISSATNIQTSGKAIVKTRTASATIGLGGGVGALNLVDSELNTFNVGTLVIGDSVNGTGDITTDSWDLSGKAHNVELYGNDITFQDTDATAGVAYAVKLGTKDFKAYARDNGIDLANLTVNASVIKALSGTSAFDLHADHDVTFNNSNITSTTGKLNITFYSDVNNATVSGGAISINDSVFSSNGGDIDLTTLGTSGLAIANSTLVNATGGVINLAAGGAVSYTSPDSFIIDTVDGSSVLLQAAGTAKNITANGQITASGTGNSATVAASGNFINGYGASLFNMTGGGRWLVYSFNPSGNTRNGLTPNAAAVYGGTFGTMAPSGIAAGNRFVFSDAIGNAPALTFVADSKTKNYGDANQTLTYTVNGFIDADNISSAFTGSPVLSTSVGQNSAVGTYAGAISIVNGSIASNLGYKFAFINGNYIINDAPPTPVAVNPAIKIDGIVNYVSSLTPQTVAASTGSTQSSDVQTSMSVVEAKKTGKSGAVSCMVVNDMGGGCAVH